MRSAVEHTNQTAPDENLFVGETLDVVERVVVSDVPCGFFHAAADALRGTRIEEGDVIGAVGGEPIRSGFTGILMGLLAMEGQRIAPHQAVAWLRTASPA